MVTTNTAATPAASAGCLNVWIGGAYHPARRRPGARFGVLAAPASVGGTWRTHRRPRTAPGIRAGTRVTARTTMCSADIPHCARSRRR